MHTFSRQLIALDMLSQEMADELLLPEIQHSHHVTSQFLKLLKHYCEASKALEILADDLTENGFTDAVIAQNVCLHLVNKKVLRVQNKLLEYVTEFYHASRRAELIRHDEFNQQADIRFDLLSTRAIKFKSQYRTVAKAMKRKDYEGLVRGIGLPEFDWRWELL